MVSGFLAALLIGQTNITGDLAKAVALWKEFGRPVAKPSYALFKGVPYENNHFKEHRILTNALALAEQGHEAEAGEKIGRLVGKDWKGDNADVFLKWLGKRTKDNIQGLTAMAIFAHILNEYIDGTPVEGTIQKLEKLKKKKLIQTTGAGTRERGIDAMISDLRQCIASRGSEGSVQFAISNLKNVSEPNYQGFPGGRNIDTAICQEVLSFGLDAIAPLANELESNVPTRTLIFAVNGDQRLVQLRHFAQHLIVKIADGDLGDGRWLTKKSVLAWLDAKKSGHVEEWLLANVVFDNSHDPKAAHPDTLQAISTKYPKLFRRAFGILAAEKADRYMALYYLQTANIPDSDKAELLKLIK